MCFIILTVELKNIKSIVNEFDLTDETGCANKSFNSSPLRTVVILPADLHMLLRLQIFLMP